ncbi:MAG: 4Fe-4S dicluster domain-containing protein [Thermoanaerobaculia bacterium]|jgi:Fe-S-cluster-containing dehydrogenase component|nr:MAG: 4Fe-4S dicluster domain-containing protein [Thermoanaerobaculia bacterium]MBZ0102771.1 4Fe-4S dicluster domain-containing protein [Thermoanaerobaculia bacterium]
MNRRDFIKIGTIAGAGLTGTGVRGEQEGDPEEFVGVLVDTTRCIGCRACERACSVAHDLPVPDIENDNALAAVRPTSETQWTVVNRFETSKGEVFVKKQCMHCWQPACGAACLTNAMYKTRSGPVIWRGNKCMGCRFCMVSCPYDIPKFEYDSWNPKIQKCSMCHERLVEGLEPACVGACPTDALTFGSKRELMEIARLRIYHHPERYVHKIYGEHEVGGTGWLYLSAVPFEEIGLRTDLGTTPYPEYTRDFLYGVPLVLFGLPALQLGLHLLAERKSEVMEDASS